jgi:LacI family transcriptional regulator
MSLSIQPNSNVAPLSPHLDTDTVVRFVSSSERATRTPSRRDRVTIADLARQCGVSPATVSRVLNKKRNFAVSVALRAKILEAARRCGYVPDLAARNMNRGKTNIVGLFGSPVAHIADGINPDLLEGTAQVLRRGGFEVFYEIGALGRQEGALPFWRFDGAILLQTTTLEAVAELDQRRVPYVVVNGNLGRPVGSVLADDRSGMRQAVGHLAALGHRRIAYANAREPHFYHYSVAERHDTLLDQARARSLSVVGASAAPFVAAEELLRTAVLDERATAVIAYDHQIGTTLLAAAYALGLDVPGDLSLICFNDVFPVAVLNPPLTAVAVSGREMGHAGADMLLQVLRGATPPTEIRIAEDLIVRGSTGRPGDRAPSGNHGARNAPASGAQFGLGEGASGPAR